MKMKANRLNDRIIIRLRYILFFNWLAQETIYRYGKLKKGYHLGGQAHQKHVSNSFITFNYLHNDYGEL